MSFQSAHNDGTDMVILANGSFPTHPIALSLLRFAEYIICCDGSAAKLLNAGIKPNAIVGDIDSLSVALQAQYSSIIHKSADQESNDLTKAVLYAIDQNPASIAILGATGLREDHTIGNISLLSHYRTITDIDITLYTDTGKFIPITATTTITTPAGSKVSIFSLDPDIHIVSNGLLYPLDKVVFDSWWKATLNQTTTDHFELIFETGKRVIIYIAYCD